MKTSNQEAQSAERIEIDPALDPALDQLSRRTFLGRAGAGAVAATTFGPAAEGQETKKRALDDPDLVKAEITFPSRSEKGEEAALKGFLVSPKNKNKHGSVLVIHEIFGLNDHIRDVACRLAQAGYTALAPNLFTREGDPPPLSGGFGPLREFVGKVSDMQIVGDLNAASKYLRARSDSNQKVGIVGFCWGGRISMIYNGSAPDLHAAVAYYGRISGEATPNQPAHPLALAEKMRAPLLGHFGEKDTGIPPAEADKLREALKAHDKKAEIYVYEGAGHAFNNDTRDSDQKEAAGLAWKRTLDWFGKYLK